MTALADFPITQTTPRPYREPGRPVSGPAAIAGADRSADRSGAVRDRAQAIRSWPLLVLAVPAAAEVWSGWVGIAQKTGFGIVPLLPGIWPSLHLDTAVTLPIGVECYAAYALRAWLSTGQPVSDRTRRFAKRSAISSFALGMAGQVAFHLMNQDHVTKAPWIITTLVSCLPVLVLGMGTALAHMLREDATAARHAPTSPPPGQAAPGARGWSPAGQPGDKGRARPDGAERTARPNDQCSDPRHPATGALREPLGAANRKPPDQPGPNRLTFRFSVFCGAEAAEPGVVGILWGRRRAAIVARRGTGQARMTGWVIIRNHAHRAPPSVDDPPTPVLGMGFRHLE